MSRWDFNPGLTYDPHFRTAPHMEENKPVRFWKKGLQSFSCFSFLCLLHLKLIWRAYLSDENVKILTFYDCPRGVEQSIMPLAAWFPPCSFLFFFYKTVLSMEKASPNCLTSQTPELIWSHTVDGLPLRCHRESAL